MSTSKWSNKNTNATEEEQQEYYRALEAYESGPSGGTTIVPTDGFSYVGDKPVEFMLPDCTEVVRAGMDLLDKIAPGWQDEINLQTLDLESDQMCILGQSWPLYARMHGLLVGGDYKQFADAVFSVGAQSERNEFAASIGCAFPGSVYAYINGYCYRAVKERYGWETEDLEVIPSSIIRDNPRLWEAVHFYNRTSNTVLDRLWEHLTKTWVTEITKAREEGRWTTVSAPASVSESESKNSLAAN